MFQGVALYAKPHSFMFKLNALNTRNRPISVKLLVCQSVRVTKYFIKMLKCS